jgi:beta-lactamase class A
MRLEPDTLGRAVDARPDATCEESINRIAAAHSGQLALMAVDLRTGRTVKFAEDAVLPIASVGKVVLLCEALERASLLHLGLETPVPVRPAHRAGGSGVLKLLPSVEQLPLVEAARLMVCVSDNTATNAIIEWMGGPERATSWARRNGLGQTAVHSLISELVSQEGTRAVFAESTVRELSGLMVRLGREGAALGSWQHTALGILASQQFLDLVPRYWVLDVAADLYGRAAVGAECCCKTGFLPGLRAEAGCVRLNGEALLAYAIVVQGDQSEGLGVDADSALVCGLIGAALGVSWLSDVVRTRCPSVKLSAFWGEL